MVRLVSIDPALLVHGDEKVRHRTWAQVLYSCGWHRGTVVAENPNLRKLISRVPDGTSSKEFQEFIIRIRQKAQSMQVPGLEGDNWINRALSTSLMDYLLVEASENSGVEPRSINIDYYFDCLEEEHDSYSLRDPKFLKTLDLLIIGSMRIDLIDKYQPLFSLNPVFRHWLSVFTGTGIFQRHLNRKPLLNIHVAHKDSDSARLSILPGDTAHDLLNRMKAPDGSTGEELTHVFDVQFSTWEPKALHSRYVIGDIGGFHLGESLNESGPVTVTRLTNHLGVRRDFDLKAESGGQFVRILKAYESEGLV